MSASSLSDAEPREVIVRHRSSSVSALWAWAFLAAACGDEASQRGPSDAGVDADLDGSMMGPKRMSREALMDPQTCSSCHPRHYREWASSMHAYASKDPVFIAMNRRGQRETDHELGDFCVNCHAPMAVREGFTSDGLDIEDVPEAYQGVTCYFCHNAVGLEADHNGKVTLADDVTMRGALRNPVDPGAHAVAYSSLHDRNSPKSSELCGSCHDVVTPKGVALERTYVEYLQSGYGKVGATGFETCAGCHMSVSRSDAKVAVMPGVELPTRKLHEHLWPAVDVALTHDFPDQEAQRQAVECALMDGTVGIELASTDGERTFKYTVEAQTGHAQPSGAAFDRRLWLEFVAYDVEDNVIYQVGVLGDTDVEEVAKDDPAYDPNFYMFRDRIYDAAGKEVHMFWEAEKSQAYPTGYLSDVLPLTVDLRGDHVRTMTVVLPNALPARVDRVTARLRMRPVGMDVLKSLVESGDLEEEVLERMPTFTLWGTAMEWTRADGLRPVKAIQDRPMDCPQAYLKHLED